MKRLKGIIGFILFISILLIGYSTHQLLPPQADAQSTSIGDKVGLPSNYENYSFCGDGICAAAYGETSATCSPDCGASTLTSTGYCRTNADCSNTQVCGANSQCVDLTTPTPTPTSTALPTPEGANRCRSTADCPVNYTCNIPLNQCEGIASPTVTNTPTPTTFSCGNDAVCPTNYVCNTSTRQCVPQNTPTNTATPTVTPSPTSTPTPISITNTSTPTPTSAQATTGSITGHVFYDKNENGIQDAGEGQTFDGTPISGDILMSGQRYRPLNSDGTYSLLNLPIAGGTETAPQEYDVGLVSNFNNGQNIFLNTTAQNEYVKLPPSAPNQTLNFGVTKAGPASIPGTCEVKSIPEHRKFPRIGDNLIVIVRSNPKPGQTVSAVEQTDIYSHTFTGLLNSTSLTLPWVDFITSSTPLNTPGAGSITCQVKENNVVVYSAKQNVSVQTTSNQPGVGPRVAWNVDPNILITNNVTATPTQAPNETATPTTAPTNTQAPTQTTTPTLSPTPIEITQEPTSTPGDTFVSLNLKLPAIGSLDCVSLPASGSGNFDRAGNNCEPVNDSRSAIVQFLNASDQKVAESVAGLQFDGYSYRGTTSANLESGTYSVYVNMDNTLVKRLPAILTITKGSTVAAPSAQLVSGDIDQNNILDLFDWNAVTDCYNNPACGTNFPLSDLNDDGKVDEIDINILSRGFAIRDGDSGSSETGNETPSPTTQPFSCNVCSTDVNGNGRVDILDSRQIDQCLNSSSPSCQNADVNGDGVINSGDVLCYQNYSGQVCTQ